MSNRALIEIALTVRFTSAASLPSLGMGHGRDLPYISGSTLKGAIKRAAEKLLDLKGIAHCSQDERLETCETKPCPICSIFGQRHAPGKVVFEGGTLLREANSAEGAVPWERRGRRFEGSEQAGSRPGGATRTFGPFAFEARLVALHPLSPDEEQLLVSAVRTVRTLGGGKAQGMGFCSLEVKMREAGEAKMPSTAEALDGDGNEVGIILVSEGPLCVARSPAGKWYRQTLDYLPGPVVKAAFYEQVKRLENLGAIEPEMANAFVAPSVSFSDCLPLGHSDSVSLPDKSSPLKPLLVLPYSAIWPRSEPNNGDEVGDNPPDMLIRDFVLRECYANGLFYVVRQDSDKRVYDAFRDGRARVLFNGKLVSVRSDVASFCPVGGSERRAVVGSRYTVFFLHPGVVFAGSISKLRPMAQEALKRLAAEKFSVGALRSRGLGRLSLRLAAPPAKANVREAVLRFNAAIMAELLRWGRLWDGARSIGEEIERKGRLFFSILFLSDLVLPRWSFWESGDGTVLEKQLSEAGIFAKEVLSYLRFGSIGGWNAACQAPRGLMRTIQRGSVCLFESRASGAAKEELCRKLEAAQDTGLGLRTSDGFGGIAVCNDFHTIGYTES
ncbi:MAG TPA: RAMP superfamily CRISPR-associated protein [bacterium]|nr:RAMP superfamily CRISPR-associated protein [bacterium]